jgi:undecaprenyl-diphosphatase
VQSDVIVWMVILALAAVGVSRLAAGDGLIPGDVWVALRAQEVSVPGLDTLVMATNWLGQGVPQTLAIALLVVAALAASGYRAEALLVLAASFARLLNTLFKAMINSPRPTIDLVGVTEEALGFGFPSGHAMGAVLLFGSLVIITPAVVRQRWLAIPLQMLAVLVILITGFGRVYSGAHWPSDVIGGYLWGLLLLQPLGWLYHRYRWQLNLRPWFPGDRRRLTPRGDLEQRTPH